jgi:hypothetical protein
MVAGVGDAPAAGVDAHSEHCHFLVSLSGREAEQQLTETELLLADAHRRARPVDHLL